MILNVSLRLERKRSTAVDGSWISTVRQKKKWLVFLKLKDLKNCLDACKGIQKNTMIALCNNETARVVCWLHRWWTSSKWLIKPCPPHAPPPKHWPSVWDLVGPAQVGHFLSCYGDPGAVEGLLSGVPMTLVVASRPMATAQGRWTRKRPLTLILLASRFDISASTIGPPNEQISYPYQIIEIMR